MTAVESWLPEGCRADGDVVICPRDVLRRLVVGAAFALQKARVLEEALREHESVRERLRVIEGELGWVEGELAGLEEMLGRLLGGLEEVEHLKRELEGVRARAERVAWLAESWVAVWECSVQLPHPDTIRRRCWELGRPRLCLLASRAANAKHEWYEVVSRLPLLEAEKGILVVIGDAARERLEREWRRIWGELVEELREAGYSTRAGFSCRRVLKLPEEVYREVREEIERLQREIEEKTRRLAELRRRRGAAKSLQRRIDLLYARLSQLKTVLRELEERLRRTRRAPRLQAAAAKG